MSNTEQLRETLKEIRDDDTLSTNERIVCAAALDRLEDDDEAGAKELLRENLGIVLDLG